MGCKVSVIVPVYNAEKYLEEMLRSLKRQTLKEIEFIFIDDCSSDRSLEMLYDFEKDDTERVIVIKLDKNEGPGGARNIGLQYASGEYIAFADSDDYMKPEMYETLYNKATEKMYDLVECGYFNQRKNKDMMLWSKVMEGKVSFDNRVRMLISGGFLWSKLYKREMLVRTNIQFISKIQYEDVDFLNRLYCKVESLGIVDKAMYYYRYNLDSFTNKGNNFKYLELNNKFSEKYLKNIKAEENYNIFKPALEYVLISIWFDTFKYYTGKNSNIDVNSLSILDRELKKHISDYDKNIFFVEKAKFDLFKKAFLINASDHHKAFKLLMENK